MRLFSILTLGVCAAVFLIVGALGWFAPDVLFGPIEEEIVTAAGRAEIRAAYGGLFASAGLIFAAGAARAEWRRPALVVLALVLGGFVFGRMVSLALDGVPALPAWITLSTELVGWVAAMVCLLLGRARAID